MRLHLVIEYEIDNCFTEGQIQIMEIRYSDLILLLYRLDSFFVCLPVVSNVFSFRFGYVEFSSPNMANKAMKDVNGTELDGREVRIDVAQPRGDGGGGRGGGRTPRGGRGGTPRGGGRGGKG